MASLETKYLGLSLKSPVIVGSSPLTQNVVSLEKCEEAGAGAVVLKSIFEEQIESEVKAEVEVWALKSKEGDEFQKYGMYITNIGR